MEGIKELLIEYGYELKNAEVNAEGTSKYIYESITNDETKITFFVTSGLVRFAFNNVVCEESMFEALKKAAKQIKLYSMKSHMVEAANFQRVIYKLAGESGIGEGMATSLIHTLANKCRVTTMKQFKENPVESYRNVNGIGDALYRVLIKVSNEK